MILIVKTRAKDYYSYSKEQTLSAKFVPLPNQFERPRSGRVKIAQPFTAGIQSPVDVVREADGWYSALSDGEGVRPLNIELDTGRSLNLQSSVSRTSTRNSLLLPARNRWAIFNCQLTRTRFEDPCWGTPDEQQNDTRHEKRVMFFWLLA
jgi:hypothetical protein